MKEFNCPVCNKAIIIGEESKQLINNMSKSIGDVPLFLKQGISIRQVCKNCNSKLEFDLNRQRFTTINLLKEYLFFNGRTKPLTSKQTIIITLIVVTLALLLSWILVELTMKGVI